MWIRKLVVGGGVGMSVSGGVRRRPWKEKEEEVWHGREACEGEVRSCVSGDA